MSDAIAAVYPKCEHQLCIVHQIRNSLKFVSYKDRKELAGDLKPIYQAVTEDEAQSALEYFEEKWGKQYPQIAKSWYNNWDNLMIFLQYPEAIRRIIYTTNSIESLNNHLRKYQSVPFQSKPNRCLVLRLGVLEVVEWELKSHEQIP